LLQDVDELGSRLDQLEQSLQQLPPAPDLNANDFLDILTGDASEAKLEFNQKNVVILKKCKELRAGRARVDKELAKQQLLVRKLADAHTRLVQAESHAQLSRAGTDVAEMKGLVKKSKQREAEVAFAVQQQERQLKDMEQAVRVELFGDQRGKDNNKDQPFNIYSLVDEKTGAIKRLGRKERLQRLRQDKQRLQQELKSLAAQAAARQMPPSSNSNTSSSPRQQQQQTEGQAADDEQAGQLSEEALTQNVQQKTQQLQKLQTVLAATKARMSAMGAERAKNITKIVSMLEDSDARDGQVKALQV
jgi:hypothetical protein